MALPLNLAMTTPEIEATAPLPEHIAWMSFHFCPFTEGITESPGSLPKGTMLILDDRQSCAAHSPDLVVRQLLDAVERLHCESILLDFQRPYDPEAAVMATAITAALPCPVAVTEAFAKNLTCPVFLAPCPLDIPLSQYLRPWQDREVWLEAALCQKRITVTPNETTRANILPIENLTGGFYSEKLHCWYRTSVSADQITFTLFDTPQSLKEKLEFAQTLGVTRFVGLYQELGYCIK